MNLSNVRWARLPVYHRHLLWLCFFSLALIPSMRNLQAATTFTGCGGEYVTATNAQAEAQVVELVNAERAKVGLPPYKAVAELTAAARYHSADMAADRYRDHYTYDRDGTDTLVQVCTWTERVKKYYPSYDQFTENVGNGTSSPQIIMDAWMASTGHKANILGNFREIGVGYANLYWTQDFTTRYTVYPLIINREARQTNSAAVSLYVYGSWTEMRLRVNSEAWGDWQAFQNEFAWTLPNVAGTHMVEIEMRSGQSTASSSDTIDLVFATSTPTPTVTRTPTATRTPTVTRTPTALPAATSTVPVGVTSTTTPTANPVATSTATPANNPVATSTATPTTTPAVTNTATATVTASPTTATSTVTPVSTPTPAPSIVAAIDPTFGGTLTYSEQNVAAFAFTIPGNAVETAVDLVLKPTNALTVPTDLAFLGQSFTLDAFVNGLLLDGFVFKQPISVRVDYTPESSSGVDEQSLLLYFYNEETGAWVDAATTCIPSSTYVRNLDENTFTVTICHLTEFAVFGRENLQLYLPVVTR